jgi:deoxycytidine triphosphate deaminase
MLLSHSSTRSGIARHYAISWGGWCGRIDIRRFIVDQIALIIKAEARVVQLISTEHIVWTSYASRAVVPVDHEFTSGD